MKSGVSVCVCDCGKGNLKCGVGAGQCAPFENFVTLLKLKKSTDLPHHILQFNQTSPCLSFFENTNKR